MCDKEFQKTVMEKLNQIEEDAAESRAFSSSIYSGMQDEVIMKRLGELEFLLKVLAKQFSGDKAMNMNEYQRQAQQNSWHTARQRNAEHD